MHFYACRNETTHRELSLIARPTKPVCRQPPWSNFELCCLSEFSCHSTTAPLESHPEGWTAGRSEGQDNYTSSRILKVSAVHSIL
jgi:hypothetical protein